MSTVDQKILVIMVLYSVLGYLMFRVFLWVSYKSHEYEPDRELMLYVEILERNFVLKLIFVAIWPLIALFFIGAYVYVSVKGT